MESKTGLLQLRRLSGRLGDDRGNSAPTRNLEKHFVRMKNKARLVKFQAGSHFGADLKGKIFLIESMPDKSFYDDGQLKSEWTYENGRLEGPLLAYFENGQLESKRTYSDGELEGLLETYYESGQLKSRGEYKKGKKIGVSQRYHSNGRLKTMISHTDGILNGRHELYDETGELTHQGHFINGQLE